jgi:hypothetical protein
MGRAEHNDTLRDIREFDLLFVKNAISCLFQECASTAWRCVSLATMLPAITGSWQIFVVCLQERANLD